MAKLVQGGMTILVCLITTLVMAFFLSGIRPVGYIGLGMLIALALAVLYLTPLAIRTFKMMWNEDLTFRKGCKLLFSISGGMMIAFLICKLIFS